MTQTRRLDEVHHHLRQGEEFTPSEVAAQWGVTRATARRWLRDIADTDPQIRSRRSDIQTAYGDGPAELSWFRLPESVSGHITDETLDAAARWTIRALDRVVPEDWRTGDSTEEPARRRSLLEEMQATLPRY